MHRRRHVERHAEAKAGEFRAVWIVEDEPAASALAVELCEQRGASTRVFRDPLPYLSALRSEALPTAIVLDWRLERELSSALFLATRHRLPRTPVMYWTGSPVESLPAMIRQDAHTMVIDKAAGTAAFDAALGWALTAPADEMAEASGD